MKNLIYENGFIHHEKYVSCHIVRKLFTIGLRKGSTCKSQIFEKLEGTRHTTQQSFGALFMQYRKDRKLLGKS